MALQTEQEYYQDENNLGSYQWFSFNDFISELEILSADNDSYIHNTRRSQFVNTTRQGVKLLQREVRKQINAFEFVVPNDLLFPYPQDYVNWISLSVVHEDKLYPIFINKGINTALTISQNSAGEILFDNDGNIIRNHTSNPTNDSKCYKVENNSTNKMQTKGQAIFNDLQGRISFGSDLQGKSVVLEYYSDGLFAWGLSDEELLEKGLKPILIHKDLKEVLIKYVYQEIVGYRRNVPANEKQRARNEYKTYLHQAKLDRLDFNLYTVAKMIR